jgi:hypothetical protein
MASEQNSLTEEERQQIRQQFTQYVEEIRRKFQAYLQTHPSNTIIYCQATYSADYDDTLKCVERVSPYVDYTIIVEDGSLTQEQKAKLESFPNVKVKTVQFKDNLPEYRNAYIEEAKKIDPYAWCLVSDPDELMSENLCRDLRNIVKAAEEEGYNMIGIYARDIWIDIDKLDAGELQKEQPYRESGFWKYLLFKLSPNFRYEGVGYAKNVHETWYSPDVPLRTIHLKRNTIMNIEKQFRKSGATQHVTYSSEVQETTLERLTQHGLSLEE